MKRINHLINGQSVESTSGRTSAVFNPATGEQTGELGLASVQEVDAAVASSLAAFDDWRDVSVARRTKILFKFRNLVDQNQNEIAARLTAEHGKVLSDAAGEVARGLENIEYACGIAELLKGSYSCKCLHWRRRLLRCASLWASWPGSPRSTSRPWFRFGPFPMPWPPETPTS